MAGRAASKMLTHSPCRRVLVLGGGPQCLMSRPLQAVVWVFPRHWWLSPRENDPGQRCVCLSRPCLRSHAPPHFCRAVLVAQAGVSPVRAAHGAAVGGHRGGWLPPSRPRHTRHASCPDQHWIFVSIFTTALLVDSVSPSYG